MADIYGKEIEDKKIDKHLLRLLTKDFKICSFDSKDICKLVKEIKEELKLAEREEKEGLSRLTKDEKIEVLTRIISLLLERERILNIELKDVKKELKELGIEEKDKAIIRRNM